MSEYFLCDIIYNILIFLDKNDSFSFINSNKYLSNHKHFLYDKYIFKLKYAENLDAKYYNYIKIAKLYDFHDADISLGAIFCICSKLINLKKLTINSCVLLHTLDNLPPNLIELRIGLLLIKQRLFNKLPSSLLTLHINVYEFTNYPINYLLNLPSNLQNLQINSSYFNEELSNLPSSLKKLIINGDIFNKPINNLPNNLTDLILKCQIFNQSLSKLPNNLQRLKLYSKHFDQSLNKLPESLTNLSIDCYNYGYGPFNNKINVLPKKLKKIKTCNIDFPIHLKSLPNSLESLIISSYNFDESIINLPNELKYLIINSPKFNQSMDKLPKGLKKLELNSKTFNQSLENLPNSLTYVKINKCEIINI